MSKCIILTNNFVALVDDENYERLSCHKWYAEKDGKTFYARTNITLEQI